MNWYYHMLISSHWRVEVDVFMKILMGLEYGIDSTLLKSNLDSSMYAVEVPTLTGLLIKFMPTVRNVQYGSSFCGR